MAESEKVVQTDKVVREDNSVRSELAENVKTESSGILDAENLHNRPADNLNVVFENPLANVPREKLLKDVEDFCQKFNLMEHVDDFRKGALVSQNPAAAMDLTELTDEERNILLREHTHKWHQPWELYWLVIMCSLAAAVQGMDETVNNGAQAIYLKNLGIESKFSGKQLNDITGLIVGAPYLCCAIIGCWLTEPMNRFFARRGTIFISCFFAAVCSIWEGVANSWVNLFIARFFLGLGIGPKSSTVPIYAAECSPAPIRGALVMMWQMWTAFGIMLGNIMGVAFMSLSDDLSWRLMLGSTVVLPVIVCTQVYFCPESPRWLIQHGQVEKAFRSFRKLRSHDIQAARDLYYAYVLVQLEREINKGKNFFTMFMELFTIGRNRRATIGSWIVMFMQQFCGVNVIAYYSTTIFTSSGYSIQSALLASMGTGILNWVFALPATLTIDTFGRRNLLLTTFPFLAICLLWTGFSFWIEPDIPDSKKRVAMVTTGFPIACTRSWHVLGDCYMLVLQLHLVIHLAVTFDVVQTSGCLWMVCCLVYHWMVPCSVLFARDKSSHVGRTRSSLLCPYLETRLISTQECDLACSHLGLPSEIGAFASILPGH
ncbi:MFS sugar transporter, putative [Talaromyces stipitatus ATCC 10500]|uniref:MFS sugar transporter, putative n=1 Tax=Talaromyces stipitatus (strain ATCC 10500 / CBS 375.48 / QM 6759 / NRRL 1006) TaxID=441959 RepID=B8M6T8_TALSN|nr:MFS sugar transporter, putative [Talaromyces stipitatus ATCC 10500]EED20157.1 MFS sugar transporter, putative [Talaromyces stipitatus ATCC 10500]